MSRLGKVYMGDTFERADQPGVAWEATDYRNGDPPKVRLTLGGRHEWLTRAELGAAPWRRCDARVAPAPLFFTGDA